MAIFYAQNVTGGSSFTVSSSVDGTIAIHEYSGVATSGAFDKKSTRTGTSNKPNTGGATTTTAGELYFAAAWSAGDGDTWTAGNGYTLRQTQTDNSCCQRIATEDQVITSASTSVAWYTTSTSDDYAAVIATFVPASGGGGGGVSSDATSSANNALQEHGDIELRWRQLQNRDHLRHHHRHVHGRHKYHLGDGGDRAAAGNEYVSRWKQYGHDNALLPAGSSQQYERGDERFRER